MYTYTVHKVIVVVAAVFLYQVVASNPDARAGGSRLVMVMCPMIHILLPEKLLGILVFEELVH